MLLHCNSLREYICPNSKFLLAEYGKHLFKSDIGKWVHVAFAVSQGWVRANIHLCPLLMSYFPAMVSSTHSISNLLLIFVSPWLHLTISTLPKDALLLFQKIFLSSSCPPCKHWTKLQKSCSVFSALTQPAYSSFTKGLVVFISDRQANKSWRHVHWGEETASFFFLFFLWMKAGLWLCNHHIFSHSFSSASKKTCASDSLSVLWSRADWETEFQNRLVLCPSYIPGS